ncbi:MAG: hypothetical protein HOU01_22245, partial [Streptomycetaceae bacterium]|nr:hypothetical protein [Streptomycetaceae bacterium]
MRTPHTRRSPVCGLGRYGGFAMRVSARAYTAFAVGVGVVVLVVVLGFG